jgi:hypothetical protein
VQRAAGIAQLRGMEVLQINTSPPCCELGRLLVALDERALDFLLLGSSR